MGLFFDSTSQEATDERVAAQDYARVVGKKGLLVEGGGLNIGAKGTYVAPLGVQVTGAKGSVTVTTADPGLAEAAFAAVENLTTQFAGALADYNRAFQSVSAKGIEAAESAQGQIAALSESAQTGGESGLSKRMLYLALGALGLFGAVSIFGKR